MCHLIVFCPTYAPGHMYCSCLALGRVHAVVKYSLSAVCALDLRAECRRAAWYSPLMGARGVGEMPSGTLFTGSAGAQHTVPVYR